ncbi:MAG: response regulator [Janthinobacterium lividum]
MASVLVLVVEDEMVVQLLLEDVLTDGGYAVRCASTAEEAISFLDDVETEFHAVITDVNLTPGKLTGWDVAKHARQIMQDIPVIYATGGSAHEWSANGVPRSILLTKPFATGQIITAISQLINEHSSRG